MKFTVTAGHGDKDPGAVALNGLTEAELMTDLRNLVAGLLRADGHQVKTDGDGLLNLPLVHALTLVPGAELAVELHTNAASHPGATGVEVVSMPSQKPEAWRIAQAIARVLEIPLRGEAGWIDQTKTARGRLGFVRAGGLVVEVFFISNPSNLARYLDRKLLVARVIADAMVPTHPHR
jgi:N-acetylmuramoyl-L-alanine amidase